jgi:uncharacterized protein (TIGR00730 family)
MSETNKRRKPPHKYSTGDSEADKQIQELVSAFGDNFDRTLLAELVTSAYRLGEDQASTLDLKILNSAMKELRYAFTVFRPYRNIRKVAIFGSARTDERHPSYPMAEAFGRLMAQKGWMVITGAASGIMRAGHEGAGSEASFGLNIRLPFEQGANEVIANDAKLVNCKYFFTRKLLFVKESQATALFPGGFGTLDEGFETLTLLQTGKSEPKPLVFVDTPEGKFWSPLLEFFKDRLVKEGMIDASECSLYHVATSAEEAAEYILKFYSVYHSMRYVGNQLVLRLHKPLQDAVLEKLSKEFKDIVVDGEMRQGPALREELKEQGDEPELTDLSRLMFQFNRRDYGRLITLIHRINNSA